MEKEIKAHSETGGPFLLGKVIRLTRGYEAIVDDKDFEYLNKSKWHVAVKKNRVSARRSVKINGRYKTLYMQNAILPIKKGFFVDHKDGNPLNNCRENLRYATQSENLRNSAKRKPGTSNYKGVHWSKDSGAWVSSIYINGRKIRIGSFNDERTAALSYDFMALKFFGEFAKINFPKYQFD